MKHKILDDKEFNVREQQLKVQEDAWAREKDLLERQNKIQQEQKQIKQSHSKKISTTKWIVFFLFANCTLIELFTGWATWKSLQISLIMGTYVDFSPLVALIGAVVTEVFGFAVYALKAKAENTAGGIIYDQAMASLNNENEAENFDPGNNIGVG